MIGRPTYQRRPTPASGSALAAKISMSSVHRKTPSGPSRVAHRTLRSDGASERGLAVAGSGRPDHFDRIGRYLRLEGGNPRLVVFLHPGQFAGRVVRQQLEGLICIAVPDGISEGGDGRVSLEAVHPLEEYDVRRQRCRFRPRRGRTDNVAQHCARFDARQLEGVADQYDRGSGRTASNRRAISGSETMDVSSTITRS